MASVKKFLNDLTGQKEARQKAEKEMDMMIKMANAKLDNLENQLKDMFRNKELESQVQIVGDRMGEFSREYRCNYQDGDVSNAVNEIINEIMVIGEDDAKKIVAKTIANALKAMFVTVSASEEEKKLFRVTFEKVALVRYDFYIWRSAQNDSGLFQHAKNVVAITYARSVVDHNNISEDELNDAIEQSMGGNADVDQVIAYKKKLIELFNTKLKDVPSSESKKQYMQLI